MIDHKFIYLTHKIYQKLRSLLLSWWLFRRIDGRFSNFLLFEDNFKPSSSLSLRIFSMFIPSASNVTLLLKEVKSLPTGVVLQFIINYSSFWFSKSESESDCSFWCDFLFFMISTESIVFVNLSGTLFDIGVRSDIKVPPFECDICYSICLIFSSFSSWMGASQDLFFPSIFKLNSFSASFWA